MILITDILKKKNDIDLNFDDQILTINSTDEVFRAVHTIEKEFLKRIKQSSTTPVVIVFHKSLRFVNPLFLSLLLIKYDDYMTYGIPLIIDLLEFNDDYIDKVSSELKDDPRQHYIRRILLAFEQNPYFKYEQDINYNSSISARVKKYRITKYSDNKVSIDTAGTLYPVLIYIYYTKTHGDTIYLNEDEFRHLLPIIKIQNFPKFAYENPLYSDAKDSLGKRKNIFQKLVLDNNLNKEEFQKNFIDIVKPSKHHKGIDQPLRDIFFEMVDNVKKHAYRKGDSGNKQEADSYFHFYYNKKKKIFTYEIIDNLDTGFINKFIETLESDEKGASLDKELYDKSLESLKNPKNDIKFLEELFSLGKWFNTHHIPRVVLHFGIPLLVNMIRALNGEVQIRLHRKISKNVYKYYKINIFVKSGELKVVANETKEDFRGTYVVINIPESNYTVPKPLKINYSIDDYKSLLKDSIKKEEMISKLQPLRGNSSRFEIFDYEKFHGNTISEFIREMYDEIHKSQIVDSLATNIPLHKNSAYFSSLVLLLYGIDHTEKDNKRFIPNVLFWGRGGFEVLFIGGERQAFVGTNKLFLKHYGQNQDANIIPDVIMIDESDSIVDSVFVNPDNVDFPLLPIDLLVGEYTKSSISKYLEDNKLDYVHFDTRQGYHLDIFYQFNMIFQDSVYFGRLAYYYAEKLMRMKDLKKVSFIGFGKYTNLFLAMLLRILGLSEDKYLIVNNLNSDSKQIDTFLKENKNKEIVIFTSVSFSGKKIEDFLDKYEKNIKSYKWFNIIKIVLAKQKQNIYLSEIDESFSTVTIPEGSYYHVGNKKCCTKCSNPKKEIPLLNIDPDDEFKLEKIYFGAYEKKQFISSYKIDKVKWFESVRFGHIERGANHYLYYTKTIDFFHENMKKIKQYLEDKKSFIFSKEDNKRNHIILAPVHCSNNKFVDMVNEIVFEGEARVFSFDKAKGIKNFYTFKKALEGMSIENYDFHFVDDEISSGNTLEYFISLLYYVRKDSFDNIFIMIDRLDSIAERLLLNYIINKNIEHFHAFTKLEIKPMKTGVEKCFLCSRRESYKNTLYRTSLDINRYAIAERLVKLNLTDSKYIDFDEKKNFSHKTFKNYLKMYAVDYCYDKFDSFNRIAEGNYEDRDTIISDFKVLESKFIDTVEKKLCDIYKPSTKDEKEIIREISIFQGTIVLLKALSFPKMVYYYNIRHMATIVLIDYINKSLEELPTGQRFNTHKISDFKAKIKKIKRKNENFNAFLNDFLNEYAQIINIDFLNSIWITAGYLNIQHVISRNSIWYYFTASKGLEDAGLDRAHMKHYQFAVKNVASYSYDKTEYLLTNVDKVLKINKKCKEKNSTFKQGKETIVKALLLENHDEKNIKEFRDYCKEYLFNKGDTEPKELKYILDKISRKLIEYGESDCIIKSVFINQYANLKNSGYENYLNKINLIDIVDNYKPLVDKEDIVYDIVRGYLSKNEKKKRMFDYQKDIEYLDSTWVNKFMSDYRIDNTKKIASLIKLVDIDIDILTPKKNDLPITDYNVKTNHPMWYKPIGCIVVLHKNGNTKAHIKISKFILSIQQLFVDYIKEKFSHGAIQESIENNRLNYYLDDYDHNIGHALDIRKIFETDIKIPYLNKGIIEEQAPSIRVDGLPKEFSYDEALKKGISKFSDYLYAPPLIVRVAQLPLRFQKKESIDDIDMMAVLRSKKNDFEKALFAMSNFVDLVPLKNVIEIDVPENIKFILKNASKRNVEAMLFEFCYNAAKHSKERLAISFNIEGNKCIVENNVTDININLHVKTRGGTESIHKYLDSLSYDIQYPNELIDGKYRLIIEKIKGRE